MTECDLWEGAVTKGGYGHLVVAGKHVYAHRLVWMQTFGSLDRKDVIMHRCDVRNCINIEHLMVGTQADNMQDMLSKQRGFQQKKTHCPSGHPYTEENTYHHDGRRCKKCRSIYDKQKKEQAA